MNQREKEEYLREYARLKSQGKPFFPYAVAKDAVMACVVMAVIITMSLVLGAEIGSKVNAASTSYDARPEWYFFLLFEILRIIGTPCSWSRCRPQSREVNSLLVGYAGWINCIPRAPIRLRQEEHLRTGAERTSRRKRSNT